jgi:hypothetical protein
MKREVEGVEEVVSALGRWSPSDLAYIERLAFWLDAEGSAFVEIVALFQRKDIDSWPDAHSPMRRVVMLFEGVAGLQLTGFGGRCVQIMGFDIYSIAVRGWEDALFEAVDYEDGRLGFTCTNVRVIRVDDELVYV